jgi:hypothetical protein
MRGSSQRYHEPARAVIFSAATVPIFCIATLVARVPIELLRTDGLFVIFRKFIPVPANLPYPVQMLSDGEILPDELASLR